MSSLQIILGDKNPDLIEAWETEFNGLDGVTVRGGNILLATADALVSPANFSEVCAGRIAGRRRSCCARHWKLVYAVAPGDPCPLSA